MKLETRSFDKGKTNFVIGVCENGEESKIIDFLGDDFTGRESIPITGEIKLTDDLMDHYIVLRKVKDSK